jgi:hypothetical protein
MVSQRRLILIFLRGIVDTCTFAALYGALRSPGDPQRLSGKLNVQEYVVMGDFANAEARSKELTTEYRYATAGLVVGCLGYIVVVIGYVFLVMAGHEHLAYGMLGVGVAILIGMAIKVRLTSS